MITGLVLPPAPHFWIPPRREIIRPKRRIRRAAITIVDIGTASSKTVNTSISVTVPAGGVPAGAVIITCIADLTAQPTTAQVSDTAGNPYRGVQSRTNTVSGAMAWGFALTALVSGNSITYNPGAVHVMAMAAFYLTGSDGAPRDTATNTTGSTTTPSAIITANFAGDAIVGMVAVNSTNNDAFTQDSTNGAFATPPDKIGTTGSTAGTNCYVAGGSLVKAAAGGQTYAPVLGAAAAWVELLASFTAAGILMGSMTC